MDNRVINRLYLKICCCFLIFLLILPKKSIGGEYAADFLNIGVGARALGMGGAFVALANDASAFYWNPAGMTWIKKMSFHFDHTPMFDGLAQYNTLNATMGIDQHMAFAVSWIRLGVDEIPRYSSLQGTRYDRYTNNQYRSTGEAEGYFNDTEDAVMVSFSRTEFFDVYWGGGFEPRKIPFEIAFGVTGKYIRHRLDASTGTGQGIDAGVIIRTFHENVVYGEPEMWAGVGLSIKDLSRTRIVWDTASNHKDDVKTGAQLGFTGSKYFSRLKSRTTLSVDREFGKFEEWHFGAELLVYNTVAVRGGYYNDEMTAGAGISLFGFTIDYAFVPGDLANTHRVSGAFSF